MSTNDKHKWYLASSDPTQSELNDAHSRGIHRDDYDCARKSGATHKEALDAHSKGINLYDYGFARESGATHNEALDAHSKGINIYGYAAAKAYGATHNEALDAHDRGLNLHNYRDARDTGATHNEALDAHSKGINLYDYVYARKHGVTHNEVLDAHDRGINLDHYGYARYHGATHNEALDAHSKGINIGDYAFAKRQNKTHYEILKNLIKDYNPYSEINWKNASSNPTQAELNDAAYRGLNILHYAEARNYGATHNEILDAHSKGIYLDDYAYAREHGATHNEILDADSKGINLYDYAAAKQKNKTHYEILKYLIPDYNPYSEINWKNASSDDDFGISKREQSEMAGRAIGEHIWDKMEDIFGPMKLQHQLHTVGELAKRFPDHIIQVDESDEPYVSHKVGDWEGRYFDGPYIEMHHVKHGPMEVIDVGREGDPSEGKDRKITPAELRGEVEHFIKHDAQQYVDSAEQNPRTSSSKQDFSGGTCLGCGTLLSTRMDSYCPTCTDIMSQSNDLDYMQTNPNHPEARPFQKPHDFSGNE